MSPPINWWWNLLCVILLPLARTDSGFLSSSASQHRFSGFRFLTEPTDLTILSKDFSPILFNCEAEVDEGFPTIVTRWKRNGQFLQFPDFNGRRRLLSNGSLFFSHTLRSRIDEGRYQCVVTIAGVGTMVSRTASLRIPDMEWEAEPEEATVYTGQMATFQCRLQTQDDDVQITWLKDEQPLILDHRVRMTASGLLEISNVMTSDLASYRCRAGTAGGATKLSQSAKLKLRSGMPANNFVAPVFLATPKNTKALVGTSEVTLDCAANGNPTPEIIWLKDGASIDLNHLDSRFTRVGSGSLGIKDLQVEDAGTYQCRAENSEDSIDSAAILQLLIPPTFVKKPENSLALEKGDIEMECQVQGLPEPTVQWYKNGDLIIESEYFQIVGKSNLKILGLVGLDSGIYQCVATNGVGNIQASAELKVTKKLVEAEVMSMKSILPADQAILDSTRLQTFPSNHAFDTPSAPLDLKAALKGSRFVTLSWSPPKVSKEPINGYSIFYQQVGSNRERVVNSTKGNLEEINIQSLSPGTSYIFRVMARNRHGVGAASQPLKITTQAELDVPEPVAKLEAKATTSFSILVSWSQPKLAAANSVTKYKLYYRQGDYAAPTRSVMVEATEKTQYHVTELREFTEYTFWLSAFNVNGEGALSEEITCMTFSDLPADPPQNISLEASSSSSIIVRWEPPPKESQNGIITGYKIRWRPKGKVSGSEMVTTDGSRRLYALTGLKKDKEYQIKMAAMTVNGTGPATSWLSERTLEADLDESVVPDPPSGLKAFSTDTDITIQWRPPRVNRIMVRGYTISWGKGIPDEYTQIVDDKHREFVIPQLKPNSEYVISLRAYNNIGGGRPIYETVRTKEKSYQEAVEATPLIPPVGLQSTILSSSTVVLTWQDSTLPRNQVIPDSRFYVVRYNPVEAVAASDEEEDGYSYRNSTDLNVMIDDLLPATEYEFAVKVIRGRRQSGWSMVEVNRTREAAPTSAPRDLVIRHAGPNSLHLSWRPPKYTNGHINGYLIQYTTNRRVNDREWFVEAVVGDGTRATIRNLRADSKYYFKMSARNNKGYGPPGPIESFSTAKIVSDFSTRNGGLLNDSLDNSSSSEANPIILYALIAVGIGIILILVIGGMFLVKFKKAATIPANDSRSNKSYHHHHAETGTREKLNPPPPDLWIGHDQLELKDISDEGNSAICDETGETTLTSRSTSDYRATMERTRNYIQNSQYSDSEVSFSLLSGNTGRSGTTTNGNRNSGHVLNNTRLIISPGSKPVKIAAISGKPRVQRYLSRESVSSSIANGSSASSSTYIRSQYNLNPPPLNIINATNTSLTMDLSMTSPEDHLAPLPGYDPSFTCTAPSDGPPSTIGDPDVSHSGAGSILGISASGAIPAQPPQVPPTYLSSAMSTSSGDSSSVTAASSNHNNLNNARRQSSGSHSSTHLRSFSNQPKNPTPSSPFKKPLMGNLNSSAFGFSSNGSDSGSSMATTASAASSASSSSKRPPSITDSPFQSGHLPTIADVRSPGVLHCQVDGPSCDCISHPMQPSLSTEELNAEMKNLEGLMKDLNSMSPMAATATMPNQTTPSTTNSYNC